MEQEAGATKDRKILMKKCYGIWSISLSLLGILSGLFFLSPNMTGNTIAELSAVISGWIGAAFFVLGLVGIYFWFRLKDADEVE